MEARGQGFALSQSLSQSLSSSSSSSSSLFDAAAVYIT